MSPEDEVHSRQTSPGFRIVDGEVRHVVPPPPPEDDRLSTLWRVLIVMLVAAALTVVAYVVALVKGYL